MKGTLRSYLRWPIFLCPLLLIMDISLYFIDIKAGFIMSGYLCLYIIIAGILFFYKRSSLLKELVQFSIRFNQNGAYFYEKLALPFSILNKSGNLLWSNELFYNTFLEGHSRDCHISKCIPGLRTSVFPTTDENAEIYFHVQGKYYKAILQKFVLENKENHNEPYLGVDDSAYFLYVYDETELINYIKENREQRLDVGLLYIDNYDETLENIEEVRRSLFSALIDRKINKYMLSIDAITKKLEKDKYIFLFQHKYLSELQNNKFSILDEVRDVTVVEDIHVTVSIGIGVQAETYNKRQEYARTAIDLALGRGGDQAVVKTPDSTLYYGGKIMQREKTTRVKARVKARALKESMEAAKHIVIMGHNLPDVDSFGAAIGVYRIAKSIEKTAHIVINQVSTSLQPMLAQFQNNPKYEEDLFLTGKAAAEITNVGTLLVVVDVNRPSYTDAPELIGRTNTIVILDHHRQTDELFKNPILSYIEPFASSTSEMVAEILQYVGEEVHPEPLEADALYSGIMIDTNNFMNKPGIRTFEAVAYLRRCGADITRIRKLFRTDIDEYKIRAEAIQNTETFMDSLAITVCNAKKATSPTIIGAKISDELLNIQGIKASFVLTAWENKIYISARSIDELNVQLVMERLGGGGHAAAAGAQLENCTLEEGTQILKKTLLTMKEKGDLL